MTPAPLNLKKGNFVQHKDGVIGQITKVGSLQLFILAADGTEVHFPYFPIDFVRLTKKEYDSQSSKG